MPVLPWITDTEENILTLVRCAREAGVPFIYPAFGLTMRDRQRAYFYHQLDRAFPGLKEKYIARYGTRYRCASPRARQLWEAFTRACDAAGILYRMQDITRRYQRGYDCGQLSFFETYQSGGRKACLSVPRSVCRKSFRAVGAHSNRKQRWNRCFHKIRGRVPRILYKPLSSVSIGRAQTAEYSIGP